MCQVYDEGTVDAMNHNAATEERGYHNRICKSNWFNVGCCVKVGGEVSDVCDGTGSTHFV